MWLKKKLVKVGCRLDIKLYSSNEEYLVEISIFYINKDRAVKLFGHKDKNSSALVSYHGRLVIRLVL